MYQSSWCVCESAKKNVKVDRLKVRSNFLSSQTRQTQLVVSPGCISDCVFSRKTCHENFLSCQINGLRVYQSLLPHITRANIHFRDFMTSPFYNPNSYQTNHGWPNLFEHFCNKYVIQIQCSMYLATTFPLTCDVTK